MLQEIDGIPMIQRTFEAAKRSGHHSIVVTDSEEIASLFPNDVVVRSRGNPINGTERLATVIDKITPEHICLLQGDECFVDHEILKHGFSLLSAFSDNTILMYYAEIQGPTSSIHLKFESSCPIIGLNKITEGYRSNEAGKTFIRTGPMFFHRSALNKFNWMPNTPKMMDRDIEWMKWIENGFTVVAVKTDAPLKTSINVPNDLK
jgi:CMP-2-keto-3-deoxyoctulosonic acid synthetase